MISLFAGKSTVFLLFPGTGGNATAAKARNPSMKAAAPQPAAAPPFFHHHLQRPADKVGRVSALVLVALALGLSNFAASIGIGLSGVDARARLRVGLVFGLFETGMPILGLALGRSAAAALGSQTRWVGAGLLIATGVYELVQSLRGGVDGEDGAQAGRSARQPLGWLLVTGLALSVDNLAVGFALGAYKVSVLSAAVVIGAVSIGLSLLGLELGARIGAAAGRRGELLGAAVLIAVGAAIAAGLL